MNPPKCHDPDDINFLIATQKSYSCLEAEQVQPHQQNPPAHDSLTRLLHRDDPDPNKLWSESKAPVNRQCGILVLDDSTLDKPYAQKMDLVTRHWSGKHHRVVRGIHLTTLLWSNGDRHIPCDYRIYDKANDNLTKNNHFRNMLKTAKKRGFEPECVCFDSWYASLAHLKTIRDYGGTWLTRFKPNRLVTLDRQGNRPISETDIAPTGSIVHLKGYGLIKVFKIVTQDGDIEYGATNDLEMNELTRLKFAEWSWTIEEYHRRIKQYTGVERAQVRAAKSEKNHIGSA